MIRQFIGGPYHMRIIDIPEEWGPHIRMLQTEKERNLDLMSHMNDFERTPSPIGLKTHGYVLRKFRGKCGGFANVFVWDKYDHSRVAIGWDGVSHIH